MTLKDAAQDSGALETDEDVARYEAILFDLDDTLYPLSSGLAAACRRNIEAYMVQKLGIDIHEVPALCTRLYKTYGTSMAGLWAEGCRFDQDDFHRFVHGRLPYELLRPDPFLRNLILSMPQRKFIFTNADEVHAEIVLKKLGLEDCFEGVICFETINRHPEFAKDQHSDSDAAASQPLIVCKPSQEAMRRAILLAKVDPAKTLYFDDSVRNIAGGKAAGLHTVLVGNSVKCEGADHAITSIHNVKEAIPEIWAEPHFFTELRLSNNAVAMETMA